MKIDANGTHEPFLIDFDFAKDVDRDSSDAHIKTHRTMSTPFLAIDLLSDPPPPALYHHDLESFVWCLWWIAVSYRNGEQIDTHELDDWSNGKWARIRTNKIGVMQPWAVGISPITINMEPARPILQRLTRLFQTAYLQHSTQEIITNETFQECLDSKVD